MAYQKNSKSKVAAIFVFDFCATVSIGLNDDEQCHNDPKKIFINI
jgi:hypothetical protein